MTNADGENVCGASPGAVAGRRLRAGAAGRRQHVVAVFMRKGAVAMPATKGLTS